MSPVSIFRCNATVIALGFTFLSVLAPAYVAAQTGPSRTEEIVKMYCSNGGHLAQCIGRKASECDSLIRPLVVLCEAEIREGNEAEQALAFSNCFGREFSGTYGRDVIQVEGCIERLDVPGAIKPPPPEFEGTGTYVPPLH